jgi:Bardet-Biedl syndrome 1 protein
MRFGSYGREENALIVIHGKGSITVKMWSRHADIDALLTSASKSGPPPEQDTPLPVPKKTKLYIEQTKRECDQASAIHRVFQRDLCKLRLETARAYVKTLTEGRMVSHSFILLGVMCIISLLVLMSLGCATHSLHHLIFDDG